MDARSPDTPAVRSVPASPEELPRGRPARPGSGAVSAPGAEEHFRVHHPQEEVDVWWGSYAARVMLPSLLFCVVLTVMVAGLAWYLWNSGVIKPALARQLAYGATGAIWLVQTVRWGYRVVAFNYRLTTRRLFRSRGWLYPKADEVELAMIAQVRVEQTWLERLLRIGRVKIAFADGNRPVLVLEGLVHPDRIASEIDKQRQQLAVRS